EPTANVVVSFAPTPTGVISPALAPLTFTATNWNLPRTITVAVPENQIAELARVVTISHVVTSSDPFYDGIASDDVTVTVLDNDTAGLIVLTNTTTFTEGGSITYTVQLATEPTANVVVSFAPTPTGVLSPALAPLTFTAANWNLPRTITVAVPDNFVVEPTRVVTISHTITSSDPFYDGIASDDVTVTVLDNDTAGVELVTGALSFIEGGSTSYTLRLTSQPTDTVRILLTDLPGGLLDPALPAELIFEPGTWNVTQTVTVARPDNIVDEPNYLVTISHSVVSNDPVYQGLFVPQVQITITDNDTAGLVVNPTSLNLSEDPNAPGATAPLSDTFTIALTTQPTATVTINLATDGQTTVSPATLTFTTLNWSTVQTVTVTAVNDAIDEPSPHTGVITITSTSTDPPYNRTWPNFTVRIEDDDSAFIFVDPPLVPITTEAGGSTSFRLWLGSEPTQPVTVTVTSSDPSEGLLSAGGVINATSLSIVFDASTWMTPFEVTVTGVDDNLVDGRQAYQVLISNGVSIDPIYNGLVPQLSVINLFNDDDEPATVRVGDATPADEGGLGTSFLMDFPVTVTRPALVAIEVDYETVDLSAIGDEDFEVTTGTLTLAPGVLNGTISVRVLGDARFEPDELFGVRLTAIRAFGDIVALDPRIGIGTIRNDDLPGVRFALEEILVQENVGTVAIRVILEAPLATVAQIGYTTLAPGGAQGGTAQPGTDYVATDGTLTFAAGTTVQTITLTILNDAVVEPLYETVRLALINPNGVQIATPSLMTVVIVDDDQPAPLARGNFMVTGGPLSNTQFGFWHTSNQPDAGNGYNYVALTVPCDWPVGSPLTIELRDQAMWGGAPSRDVPRDFGIGDTIFELYDVGTSLGTSAATPGPGATGSLVEVVYSPQASAGWEPFYTINNPQPCGSYILRSVSSGDDENYWGVRAGFLSSGTLLTSPLADGEGVQVGTLRMTVRSDTGACLTGWFYVPAGTSQLNVRTFDMDLSLVDVPGLLTDPEARIRLYPPGARFDPRGLQDGLAAIASGMGVWQDNLVDNPVSGWWRSVTCTTANNNAYIIEAQTDNTLLPIYYVAPTRPEVALQTMVSPTSIAPGATSTVSVSYQGGGTGAAHQVDLVVRLPVGLSFVGDACSGAPGSSCTQTADQLTIRVDRVSPLDEGSHSFSVQASPTLLPSQVVIATDAFFLDALGKPGRAPLAATTLRIQ
ncbi:MAG: Calx-beta domain-containing protein, partial [Oscillochloridaceae bacterium umkhey_bin13]